MNPRVLWARTSDGVNIGFTIAGAGSDPPLLWLPPVSWSHSRLIWDIPNWGLQFERLITDRPFACMDYRGQGLSDRDAPDFSLEAFLRDIDTVVERLGWPRFALYGHLRGGMLALAYAHRNPERVAGLILDSAIARLTDRPPELPALAALRQTSWDMYVDAIAHLGVGWDRSSEGRLLSELFHAATTQAAAAAADAGLADVDLTPILPDVTVPTLILQRPEDPFATNDGARYLATHMPNARTVVLKSPLRGPSDIAYEDQFIEEFLDELTAAERERGVESGPPAARPARDAPLTPPEIEVLRLIVDGRTNKEIAAELALSPRTVARHIANIYDKIDTRGKAEATAYAIRHGLTT